MESLNCILILEDTKSFNPDFRCPPSTDFFPLMQTVSQLPHIILPILFSALYDHARVLGVGKKSVELKRVEGEVRRKPVARVESVAESIQVEREFRVVGENGVDR